MTNGLGQSYVMGAHIPHPVMLCTHREAHHLAERNTECYQAREVVDALTSIYYSGLDAKGSKSDRRRLRDALRKRVRRIIEKYADQPVLNKFMNKLASALPDLFGFVINPAIPSTNNPAERGLHEPVVHRKVRGSIRSRDTMSWLANIFTCAMTWKASSINYATQLAAYI